nr:ribonuclease H-like domain-containing protein [Tanacetum cinerariifolium]
MVKNYSTPYSFHNVGHLLLHVLVLMFKGLITRSLGQLGFTTPTNVAQSIGSSTVTLPSANLVNLVVYHTHVSSFPNFIVGPADFNAGGDGYSGLSLVYHTTQVQPIHYGFAPPGFTYPTAQPNFYMDPTTGAWNMDTGASSNLNDSFTSLSDIFNMCIYPSVSVGDGHSISVTNTGHSILPTPTIPLHLNNILITPTIVKNLIYVRQFVRDNNCTVEFDVFGFLVKDFMTRRVLLQCDSTWYLYLVTNPSPIPHAFFTSQHTWHQRLGHPGSEVLRRLISRNFVSLNKEKPLVHFHACQLGKHMRLPSVSSNTLVTSCFDIVHSDVWTLPFPSLSGFKYYVLFLNHYSHFVWVYLLINKPDVLSKFMYRCLDLNTNKISISRHVTFDEMAFPYGSVQPTSPLNYTFLDDSPDIITQTIFHTPIAPPTNVQEHPDPTTPLHTTEPITQPIPAQQSTMPQPTAQQTNPDHSVVQQTPPPYQTMAQQAHQIPISDPTPTANPNPVSVHPMVTRFRVGTNCPIQLLNLHVSSISHLPNSYNDTFNDPNWQNAACDEYNALLKIKLGLYRYKDHLVANGSTHVTGIDVDGTFSPVVKSGTIRTVLSLATTRHRPIHQLDVKNAFLHGDLSETIYMHQPLGFQDFAHPDYVCLLQRSLYGLKQAPRAWFQRFASYITRQITRSLHPEFSMTDLGSLNYFMGISIKRDSSWMFLSQCNYAIEILERAHMVNCNPTRTLVDTESKLGDDGDPVSNMTLYQSFAGSLRYLTFTRLDISYAVHQVCLYMHDPREPYFSTLKRILRAEAEYRGVANAVVETCWLMNLL